MINNFSVGVDIEEISRFDKYVLDKNKACLLKIFTLNELNYSFKDKQFAAHLAVRFCAKEAVYKSLSVNGKVNIKFSEIEILNKKNGVPFVNILNENFSHYSFNLSLSHSKNNAIAYVVTTW